MKTHTVTIVEGKKDFSRLVREALEAISLLRSYTDGIIKLIAPDMLYHSDRKLYEALRKEINFIKHLGGYLICFLT